MELPPSLMPIFEGTSGTSPSTERYIAMEIHWREGDCSPALSHLKSF